MTGRTLVACLGNIFLSDDGFGVEVARRFVVGSEPEAPVMIAIAVLALVANVGAMALLAKHRTGGLHMRASWIFTTTDVIANIGVVLAGALVAWTRLGPD